MIQEPRLLKGQERHKFVLMSKITNSPNYYLSFPFHKKELIFILRLGIDWLTDLTCYVLFNKDFIFINF